MAVTETYTVQDVCTAALRKIGVVSRDEAAQAEDIEAARAELSRMLKGWQNHGPNIFLQTLQSVTLTTATSYTMSPVRPLSIESVRYKSTGGIETPMERLTREEYDSLPDKTTTGIPTTFHYSRQRESALLYIWPALSSATTESLEITYIREIDDLANLSDTLDVPGEWFDCVVYNLADRLSDDFDIEKPKVTARAAQLYRDALAFDQEESVYFYGNG